MDEEGMVLDRVIVMKKRLYIMDIEVGVCYI